MGNHIGIARDPANLHHVLGDGRSNGREDSEPVSTNKQRNSHDSNDSNNASAESFTSTLHVWRFYKDPEDAQNVKIMPVFLCESFKAFDKTECFLLLYVYKSTNRGGSADGVGPGGAGLPGTPKTASQQTETNVRVSSLFLSSHEALTPRGLLGTVGGGLHTKSTSSSTSSNTPDEGGNSAGNEQLHYDVYVWNGKDSEPLTREKAVAKGRELEAVLKDEKRPVLRTLFFDGEKAPLTSVFKFDVPRSTALAEEGANHLFKQLIRDATSATLTPTTTNGASRPTTAGGSETTTTTITSTTNFNDKKKDSDTNGKAKKKAKKRETQSSDSDSDESSDEEPEEEEPRKPPPKVTRPAFAAKLTLPPNLNLKTKMEGSGGLRLPIAGIKQQEGGSGEDDGLYIIDENKQKGEKLKRYDIICSKITDDLFLGSQTVSRNKEQLKSEGITHILNCAGAICPEYYPNDFVYRTLYLTDGVKEDILCLLYDIIEWMEDVISKGGKLYVHCQQGVSRSSAMMIGYLMWKRGLQFEEAHMFVKGLRGVSSPNPGFICQLLYLGHRLTSTKSRMETRLYTIINQNSRHDTNFLVAKNIKQFPVAELTTESKSCFIAQTPEVFYVWVGSACKDNVKEVALQTVRRVRAFEGADGRLEVVKQGEESEELLYFLKSVVTQSPADIFASAKKREKKTETETSST
eukprot:TRINITY_DN385_c0_g1_i1.p1 TRINITY_DN385_c0_g1~~TRINITY_DN385_c0_g1_i1.p1  ORF type:complete len:690 (+),score=116.08 TRINITY_DN385_c0_g1_i1:268-2337(+)